MHRSSLGSLAFDVFNTLFMILLICVMVVPLLHVIALSFSDPEFIAKGEVSLLPKKATLLGFEILSRSQLIGRSYLNTIVYTIVHTLMVLLICSLTAYPLAFKTFHSRKLFTVYLVIPMFFSGGLIPFFLVVRSLGMIDTLWAVVLPIAFSPWYIILFRTNFQTLPTSLRDSAYIDGANDLMIWSRIYIPLSKPIIATIGLFAAVGMWNNFFQPYIFLNDQKKFPLQIILRKLLLEGSMTDIGVISEREEMADRHILLGEGITEMLKHVATVVTIGPIILVYPFIQRYFTKGILVGAIKG